MATLAPVFIMIAASLWAVDALFRTQLTFAIPPAAIVLFEHALGFLILSPIFIRALPKYRLLSVREWLNFGLLTVLSSVVGTLLFTAALTQSYTNADFVTPILLQKLQPVFVIFLSAIFLHEKLSLRFLGLSTLALIGSYMISFGTDPVAPRLAGQELVFLMALGAAAAWGTGTVMSKHALKTLTFWEATALRFLLAVPVSFGFVVALDQGYNPFLLDLSQVWRFVVIASLTGGVGALLLYYRGLQSTPAGVATMAELLFPVVSILIAVTPLNPYGAPQLLTLAHIFGVSILLLSVLILSFDRRAGSQ